MRKDVAYVPGHSSGTIFPAKIFPTLTPLAPYSHMWGQHTLIISSLSPKRNWGPKRVNRAPQLNIAGVFFRDTNIYT